MRLLFSFLLIASTYFANAQAQYEITQDEKHPDVKILRGFVNKYLVQNDTAFSWYAANAKGYKPDSTILNALEKGKSKLQYVVFGGTWCEDTQNILPRFFKLQEMSGVPDDAVTFFGVNRAKKSLGSIADAFGITNVPTIIVMKAGKEVGRIVEYGKTGYWDKELGELVKASL